MDDKVKPCQQEIAKRAPRHWNRLDFSSKRRGKFRKTKSKFWNATGFSSKAGRVVIPACGAAILHETARSKCTLALAGVVVFSRFERNSVGPAGAPNKIRTWSPIDGAFIRRMVRKWGGAFGLSRLAPWSRHRWRPGRPGKRGGRVAACRRAGVAGRPGKRGGRVAPCREVGAPANRVTRAQRVISPT
jgi:hypothetical protein